jgi:hypothetical protein
MFLINLGTPDSPPPMTAGIPPDQEEWDYCGQSWSELMTCTWLS